MDHVRRHHLKGASEPCTAKPCKTFAKARVYRLLEYYEGLLPFAPDLRRLRALLVQAADAQAQAKEIVQQLVAAALETDTFPRVAELLTEDVEWLHNVKEWLVEEFTPNRFVDIFRPNPLDHFRAWSTAILAASDINYPEIAELVDDGEKDRTRKNPGWRLAKKLKAREKSAGKTPR